MSALNGINKTLDMPMDLESISLTEQVYRSVLIIVSLAINTGVLVVICCSRQLHYPRHIYWAAISIVNNLSAFQWINEILGIVLQIEFARQGFVLNVGIVYTMLLHCLFLATIDRYVAIAHYKWYKKKVTNKIVVTLLVTTTGATYLAGTSPFWTGVKRISSGTVNLTHMNCLLIWDLILGIMCVVINFRILTLSRFFIKQYMDQHTFQQTPISILFSKSPNSNAGSNGVRGNHSEHGAAMIDVSTRTNGRSLDSPRQQLECKGPAGRVRKLLMFNNIDKTIHSGSNRLETRVALSFSANVLPFCLCTFPVTLTGITIYLCVYFQASCHAVFPINRHVKHLFFMHNIYNPIAYALTSKEFRRALWRFVSA